MPSVADNRRMPPKKTIDTSTYKGRIAKRLRALRESAGVSVEELSSKLIGAGFQINPPAIYAWEQGRSCPSVETLPLLAKLYGLDSPGEVLPKR